MNKLLGWVAIVTAIAACNGSGGSSGTGGTGGSGGGTECGETPTQCPAGQTCWVNDAVTAFECLPSGAGKQGEMCSPTKGVPTCADGLFCFQPKGTSAGACTQLCDAGTNPCGEGNLCVLIEVGSGVQTHLCQ